MPQAHTIREFTEAEKEDGRNRHLNGVRSYFFHANHNRGMTDILPPSELMPYDDYAWVPKRKMNEFFTRDYYDIFAHACTTR